MSPEQEKLPHLVREFFARDRVADILVCPVAGAAVLEVVVEGLTETETNEFSSWLFKQMGEYNESLAREEREAKGLHVHALFLYADHFERYTEDATLHTIRAEHEGGRTRVTTTPSDAFLLMAASEVETLLLGSVERPFSCKAIFKWTDILVPPTPGRYVEVEVGGRIWAIDPDLRRLNEREWTFSISD